MVVIVKFMIEANSMALYSKHILCCFFKNWFDKNKHQQQEFNWSEQSPRFMSTQCVLHRQKISRSDCIAQMCQWFFIGPESDHWLPLSVTNWLTLCCLVDLIDVTLACEDANSKLVEVVSVVDVDAEDHVGNSLLQIWELTFGPKELLFRLWAQGWSRFWSWSSGKILKLEFVHNFAADVL